MSQLQQNQRKRSRQSYSAAPPRVPRVVPSPHPASIPPSDGADRLTALPDALRLHILSLLPLKSAVATSSLSSHWRHLHHRRHLSPFPSVLRLSQFSLQIPPSVLLRHLLSLLSALPPPRRLDSLHLALLPAPRHLDALHRSLNLAATARLGDLFLDLNPQSVPRSRRATPPLFLSAPFPSLVRLSLAGLRLSSPLSFYKALYSLESVSLADVILSDAALRRIVANCPLLATLDVRRCQELKKIVVPGTGLRLRSLTFVDCWKVVTIRVECPGLRRFRWHGRILPEYQLEHVAGLEDVYFGCGEEEGGLPPVINWMGVLSNYSLIRVLTLCSVALQYVSTPGSEGFAGYRYFQFLKELQLLMLAMGKSDLMAIYCFFRICRCPKLEKLFIELPNFTHDPYVENFLEAEEEEPPADFLIGIKVIKIKNFKGHQYEMQLVRSLLWRAISLESLILVTPQEPTGVASSRSAADYHSNVLHFLHLQINMMPRISPSANIILSEEDDIRYITTPGYEGFA